TRSIQGPRRLRSSDKRGILGVGRFPLPPVEILPHQSQMCVCDALFIPDDLCYLQGEMNSIQCSREMIEVSLGDAVGAQGCYRLPPHLECSVAGIGVGIVDF